MTALPQTRAARIWHRVKRFLEAMDGVDDPEGQYLAFLERRIGWLEGEVRDLQAQFTTARSTPEG